MKTLAPALLLLAACASRRAPEGEPATLTLFGEEPRLEAWRAFVVEDGHVHSASPGAGCLFETLARFARSDPRFRDAGLKLDENLCGAMLGAAHGGRGRLVLLLVPPGDAWPGEALAVDVPRLAPGETERTFAWPDLRIELERPAGTRRASIDRGRVTLRRLSEKRYDVELFAVLKPGPIQVVARAQAGGVP